MVKAQPIGTSAPTVRLYSLPYTVLVSRARVGARVEITKNDLGKISRKKKHKFLAVVHSDFLAWLTSATLRFLSLAEQYHTQIS